MTSGALTRNAVQEALALAIRRSLADQPVVQNSERPRRTRPEKAAYSVSSPSQFNLNRLADIDNLNNVFQVLKEEGGQGAGVDGLSYNDFCPGELFSALRAISAAIKNRTYRPYGTRLVEIDKGGGRVRELKLQIIADRVISKALQLAMEPYWRTQLPGIGQDVWRTYAQLQRVMREHKAYVIVPDDIEDCFPSAPIEQVFNLHRQHTTNRALLWLIEQIIRGHDAPDRMTGLDQGSPYSPVAMELLLHHCLDTRLETVYQGFPLLLRYVDNLTFICRSVHEGCEILQVSRDILAEQGLRLKGEDGPPIDLWDSQHNKVLLGVIPRWQDGMLKFSIPESAYEELRSGFFEARSYSRPIEVTNSIATGWIESVGPTLANKVLPEVVDRVLDIARSCGYRNLNRKELYKTADRARKRWLALSNPRGGSING